MMRRSLFKDATYIEIKYKRITVYSSISLNQKYQIDPLRNRANEYKMVTYESNIVHTFYFDEISTLIQAMKDSDLNPVDFLDRIDSSIDDYHTSLNAIRALSEKLDFGIDIRMFNIVQLFSGRVFEFTNEYFLIDNLDRSFSNRNLSNSFYFYVRDIIESIEVMSFLSLNKNMYSTDKNGEIIINEKHKKVLKSLEGKTRMSKEYIDEGLANKLKEKYGGNDIKPIIEELKTQKKMCNHFIHRNGYSKLFSSEQYTLETKMKRYDLLTRVLTIFFIFSFIFDNTCVQSSDYVDYLDCNMSPPENSQYWVAPIFTNFYKKLSNADKLIIDSYNYYDMDLSGDKYEKK